MAYCHGLTSSSTLSHRCTALGTAGRHLAGHHAGTKAQQLVNSNVEHVLSCAQAPAATGTPRAPPPRLPSWCALQWPPTWASACCTGGGGRRHAPTQRSETTAMGTRRSLWRALAMAITRRRSDVARGSHPAGDCNECRSETLPSLAASCAWPSIHLFGFRTS